MKRIQAKIVVILITALLLFGIQPAFAANSASDAPLAPCAGQNVSGTVVAVDSATGVVTINTPTGLCTVTLTNSASQPIAALLGSFFGDVKPETLSAALANAQGCALLDPTANTWKWASCTTPGAVPVQVTAQNTDGTFAAQTFGSATTPLTMTLTITDTATVGQIRVALSSLAVQWMLDGSGDMLQVSEQVEAYHEAGMGFGVLVKLYSIAAQSQATCAQQAAAQPATIPPATTPTTTTQPAAQTCGVTVEELVSQFQSGMGIGQLFKNYGKPAQLGVGQVRQALREREKNNKPAENVVENVQVGQGQPQAPGLGQGQSNQNKGPDKVKVKGPCKSSGHGKGHGNPNCP
ncbi:MAG TPA: hypothetical protein VF498_13855 [Anaerolineales bacterium]